MPRETDADADTHGEPSECTPVWEGLQAWYRGEGDAVDEMGANPGTLVGGAGFSAGKVGTAFDFRKGGYVEVPSSASLTLPSAVPSSVEGWFVVGEVQGDAVPLTAVKAFGYGVLLWPDAEGLRPHVHDGVAWLYREGRFRAQADTWHHVVQVWDGSALDLYLDGATLSFGGLTSGIVEWSAGTPVLIGQWDLRPVRDEVFKLNGAMDEIRIYSRALSPEEVEHNYQIGASGVCG